MAGAKIGVGAQLPLPRHVKAGDWALLAVLLQSASNRSCWYGCALDKLSVVLVAVFSALFLGERLPPFGWFGVLLMAQVPS